MYLPDMEPSEINTVLNLIIVGLTTALGFFLRQTIGELKEVKTSTTKLSMDHVHLNGKLEVLKTSHTSDLERIESSYTKDMQRIQEVTELHLQRLTKEVEALTKLLARKEEKEHNIKR